MMGFHPNCLMIYCLAHKSTIGWAVTSQQDCEQNRHRLFLRDSITASSVSDD